jgi:molecular chaperone Hsp33
VSEPSEDQNRAALGEPRASALYTFVDAAVEHAIFFLEGQRLIFELARIHPVVGAGFAYFRDAVLSLQPMLAFLKRGEQIGLYIDSEEPLFRLKIESSFHGHTRCSLMPEGFHEFPEAVVGVARVVKLFADQRPSYSSVVRLDGLSLGEIVNRVLQASYQVGSVVVVSEAADQSAMIHRLPATESDEVRDPMAAARRLRDELQAPLEKIFALGLSAPQDIEAAFAAIGFRLIATREVQLRCSCSHERMVRNLRLVAETNGGESLETTCDYCKRVYRVSRDDIKRAADPMN